jgi:hypothetical protein
MLLGEGFTVACFDVRAAALDEMRTAILAKADAGERDGWGARIHPYKVDVSH